MSNVQSIINKANALNASETEAKQGNRQGAWVEVESFEDPDSGLGVVIKKKTKGKPAYSISMVHFSDRGENRFIPFPLHKLQHPIEDITYLLMKRAREWMEEHPLQSAPRRDKRGQQGKRGNDTRDRSQTAGGLSTLAQRDSQKGDKDEPYKGKTARKREKKQGG